MRSSLSALFAMPVMLAFVGCAIPGGNSGYGTAPGDVQGFGAARQTSWVLPGAAKQDLLYVADYAVNTVYVLNFPQGALVGELSGFDGPWAVCTDPGGNVWISNFVKQTLVKYEHGGSEPVKTLKDSRAYPVACSVDATTDRLAVANRYTNSTHPGNVVIFNLAKDTATTYTSSNLYYYDAVGYDSSGNLFADGAAENGSFGFAELPAGATKFKPVSLDVQPTIPVGIQWLGTSLALGAAGVNRKHDSTVLQVEVSNGHGTVSHTTSLAGYNVSAFFVEGSILVASEDPYVEFFNYPAGGKATVTLTGFESPIGVAVSVAP